MQSLLRASKLILNPKRGFTLPEVLVATGLAAILLSLLLSAVQAGRESARRIQCLDRLRQLGLATRQFAATHGHLPTVRTGYQGPSRRVGNSSPFLELAPHLGLNLGSVVITEEDAVEDRPLESPVFRANAERLHDQIALFRCPSDDDAGTGLNYRANMGTWAFRCSCLDKHGAFSIWKDVRDADFTDGASQTVLFSERLRGDGNPSQFDHSRDVWVAREITAACIPDPSGSAGTFVLCQEQIEGHDSFGGKAWFSSGFRHSWYNHLLTPNSARDDVESWDLHAPDGVVTARSLHSQGVNVVFASGDARFISESVNSTVWKALGTRSGGEPVVVP